MEERKHWKELNNAQLIMYQATQENKWEILDYFLVNNPSIFKSILKNYTRINGSATRSVVYNREEILNHYADIDLETAPEILQQVIMQLKTKALTMEEVQHEIANKVRNKKTATNNAKKVSWTTTEGDYFRFFNVGKFAPQTREEYFAVFEKFMQEDLSVSEFCKRYAVSSETGFKHMLEKFARESADYAEKINIKNQNNKAYNITQINNLIYDVCFGNQSVSALIDNAQGYSLFDFHVQAKNFGEEYSNILSEKVIDYFYDRINQYNYYSVEPENIKKMLSRKELAFIVGDAQFESMMAGRPCDVPSPFLRSVLELNTTNPRLISTKVRGRTVDRLEKGLILYNNKFNKKEYFKTQNFVLGQNQNIEVTPEIVDRAYQFVYESGLFPSDAIMSRAIRSVACQMIDNKIKTADQKVKMLAELETFIDEVASIYEYFSYIDEVSKERE